MLSTIVNPSVNTAQLFFLIAVIVSIIAAAIAFQAKTWWALLLTATVVFIALGLLFLP